MAENITSLELNGIKYALGKSIYAELDLSLERFVELLGRDFYCPTLNSAPTSTTRTYQDTDESVNTFQIGQPCRWKESDGTYRLAVLADMTSSSATWYKLPVKVSELTNDAGYTTETQLNNALSAKQDVIGDLADIRSGAAKGATALQSIPSEYITETELTNKGYATTSSVNSALNGKVDKDGNKVLSTNDFTNALKTKLEGLSNYDDTTISNAVNKLRTDFDTLVSGDTTTAIKTFNEVIAFLDGITDTQDLEGIIASIEQQIAAKQDKITDLETIRQGAELGATALQSYTEKYTGTYSKPENGIPKTDLASGVQESLGKADTSAQKFYIQKTLNKEGWYRIGLLTAIMSTSSARIVVGGTNADVSPIIMDFQHNFRGDMLSQMPTVMTPLYVTKVRAVKLTSDDVYIDLYFTNIAGSLTTVSVFPLEGEWESMNFVDVTSAAGGTVSTTIDIVQDGFLDGKVNASDLSTYLSKTDAASTYLGKTAKAASATTADSSTKATQDANGNVIASTYATKSSVNAKQDAALKFENMNASTWVSDSTYEDFPYRCDIACSGVTSSMYAEVVFGVDEAISGDYAPMCETKSNIVSIWSAKNETITVPTILITK